MLSAWLAAEVPEDPIWLRTLATLLPFLGPIVVGLIAAPWLAERVRNGKADDAPTIDTSPGTTALPAPVAQEATARAQADPLLRLLIEDLHNRLNEAHREAATFHTRRAEDAVLIARLTAEIDELQERYQRALVDLDEQRQTVRTTRSRLREIQTELEQTRRRLQICMEGYQQ
jgi:hypothetical protein